MLDAWLLLVFAAEVDIGRDVVVRAFWMIAALSDPSLRLESVLLANK